MAFIAATPRGCLVVNEHRNLLSIHSLDCLSGEMDMKLLPKL